MNTNKKKKINLLDNEVTQQPKFRIKSWVEINDDVCGIFINNWHIKLKTTMLKLNLRCTHNCKGDNDYYRGGRSRCDCKTGRWKS